MKTTAYSEMGQSWSTPAMGPINDGGTIKDVLFISAGYDLNQDTVTPGLDPAPTDTMGSSISNRVSAWRICFHKGNVLRQLGF